MKKSKIFVVIALAVVLCVVSVTSTTFSWFTRPSTKTTLEGDRLLFPGKPYDVSTGNGVTFETYESTDGGETYGTTPVTDFNGTNLATNTRKMYRTDITNSGTQAQSVSLYLHNLNIPENSNGYFYLGVNSPLKTYKIYGKDMSDGYEKLSGTKTPYPSTTMRVYFQPNGSDKEPNINWKDKEYFVYYGDANDTDPQQAVKLNKTTSYNVNYYSADIPLTTSLIYFATADYYYNDSMKDSYRRTPTIDVTAIQMSQSKMYLFWLTGEYDNYEGGYNNAQYNKTTDIHAARIINYYPSVTIPMGTVTDEFKLKDGDYWGYKVQYYSDNKGYFTVDENTGMITPQKIGTEKMYVKVTNNYEDTIEVITMVNIVEAPPVGVSSFEMAPVVTNVKVGAKTDDGPTTESVYWYIKNNSSSTALSYTVDSLDLTL